MRLPSCVLDVFLLNGKSFVYSPFLKFVFCVDVQFCKPDVVQEALKFRESISVVKDGVTAFQTGFVNAMHDPTEGGLSGGIHELCDASGVGFEIDNDLIPITKTTKLICDSLQINPLELISSGSMLISCDGEKAAHVIDQLESAGVGATIVGSVVSDSSHRKIVINGLLQDLQRPTTDELWSALKKVNPS